MQILRSSIGIFQKSPPGSCYTIQPVPSEKARLAVSPTSLPAPYRSDTCLLITVTLAQMEQLKSQKLMPAAQQPWKQKSQGKWPHAPVSRLMGAESFLWRVTGPVQAAQASESALDLSFPSPGSDFKSIKKSPTPAPGPQREFNSAQKTFRDLQTHLPCGSTHSGYKPGEESKFRSCLLPWLLMLLEAGLARQALEPRLLLCGALTHPVSLSTS
ncbi:hypothetical protein MJG53_015573 [Ovis ammon polii x Ovis aries]|uniref:Uncharacterized protein n=1 Tax=Ovis ammon polii x Ovis aries TaxID=2918886 RepID=A0ACB9UFG9_9CETA|nr:hypothetical protein MJG53_015573 [Ovis ammon polii x Ovis aries]